MVDYTTLDLQEKAAQVKSVINKQLRKLALQSAKLKSISDTLKVVSDSMNDTIISATTVSSINDAYAEFVTTQQVVASKNATVTSLANTIENLADALEALV
jgi:flagellar biosynthesis chaperone FliJ